MATKQELQLEILNPEYSRFVKDQVLTEVQLNEIIDFFEDQHRLTRTCLIGTGIVCGLHMNRKGNVIILDHGAAITTDGDIIKVGTTRFEYFTQYTPPENSHYDPFYYESGGKEKMVSLYELITEEDKEKLTISDIKPLSELDGTIKDWVALIYLEYFLKDPEKCTPTNCDNLGMRQVARPKVMILSKDDMDKVIHKDEDEQIGDDIYLKYKDAYDRYFTFPPLKAKRVILNRYNTIKSNTLAGAYFNATKDGAAVLAEAVTDLYEAFRFLIDKDNSLDIKLLTDKLISSLTKPSVLLHAQYTYDFYKDIIQAYNELRELLYNLAFECCPNIYAFPKHIMLGAPNILHGQQQAEYRHQFYPSPAVTQNKKKAARAISMLERLRLLIESFDPQPAGGIRITPSRDYDRMLDERAIPFYYNKIRPLSKVWSYPRARKGLEKQNLSYHADQYEQPVPEEVLQPLDYDIDGHDFFRIEGHIGKDFKTVLKQLDSLKVSKGVPMDVVAVRLGDVRLSDIDLGDFECHFEDLNTMLRAFQVEMNCLLADGTAFFSGFTPRKELPHINLQRYVAGEGQPKWIIHSDLLKSTLKANLFEGGIFTREATLSRGRREILTGAGIGSVAGAGRGTAAGATGETPAVDTGRFSAVEKDDILSGLKKTDSVFAICDPFVRPVFTGDRIVKTRIDLNPETFGKYYLKALEGDVSSVDDFMEKARLAASEDPDLNKLDEDEKYVAFEYPMQIIGHLNYIQRYVPAYLGDISEKMITDYRGFSQAFCKRLKVMHTRLERYFRTGNYIAKGYENRYINMLDNLEKICCGNEKLEVILKEIEKRKAEILKNLSFSRFSQQHPGLEHKAGVHRGGTFVIVYAGSGRTRDPRTALKEILEARRTAGSDRLTDSLAEGLEYRDAETFAYFVASNEDVLDKEAELSKFLAFQKVPEGTVFSERMIREVNDQIDGIRKVICRDLNQPEQDIVIADFCLPYLCCSECPPVAFIIQKDQKQLALPVDSICSGREPIPFSAYTPKGAIITSPEAPESVIPGDNPMFDPRKVPENQIGKTITFLLDGETTDCAIVVKSAVSILTESKVSDSGRDEFTVEYMNKTDESVSGQNIYIWKFNDGTADEIVTGTASFNRKYSKRKLASQNIASIAVTIAIQNDPCESVGTLTVPVPTAGEQPDACLSEVVAMVEKMSKELANPKMVRRIREMDHPQLLEIYSGTVKIFDAAHEMIFSNDPRIKARLMLRIHESLKQIYEVQLIRTNPDVARILEILIRKLLMLMLMLVFCDAEIDPKVREILGMQTSMFQEMNRILLKKFPELDLANELELQVQDFARNYKSQDPNVMGMIKLLITGLKNFPETR